MRTHCSIESRFLGPVDWNPESELLFPAGLPGFEEERRIVPVEIPVQRPLIYLQSADDPEVCFATLPVLVINPRFLLRLSEEDRSVLRLPENCEPVIGNDVLCLGLLAPSGKTVQSNLNAPIVINLQNFRGAQCISSASESACFRLAPDGRWERAC